MIKKSKVYFENLDALRAFAALAVVFSHFPYWLNFPETTFYKQLKHVFKFGDHGGKFGVTFFFILSGFLISYLLFDEWKRNGKIQVLHFYLRRVLRIWPLYFLSVLIGFVIYPVIGSSVGVDIHENANPWMYIFFAANFDHIYGAFPAIGMLGVQWSVCVEEQFYLIWPLFLMLFKTKFWFPLLAVFIIIFSQWFYVSYMFGINGGPYHLFCSFRFLALGALLAWLCFFKFEVVQKILARITRTGIMIVYVFGFGIIIFQTQIEFILPVYKKFDDILPAVFFAFIILEQNYSNHSFLKFGQIKFMTYLGKISYGIYLLHMVAIYICIHVLPSESLWIPIKIGVSLLLTFVLADFSYKYFETFFLRLKKKFETN